MTWIFGSFLVTSCALASCHILISKQEGDSMIRAFGYNRCVTGRRPRDENHTVRFGQCAENHSWARDMQPIRGRLWRACKGVHALAPPGSGKKIWERVILSLSICFSTNLSHTTETSTLSRIKCERYIFIKKCVRSFIEVRKLCLIMFPLIFVLRLYNTSVLSFFFKYYMYRHSEHSTCLLYAQFWCSMASLFWVIRRQVQIKTIWLLYIYIYIYI